MTVNEEVLKRYDLSLNEFLILALYARHAKIDSDIQLLLAKGIGVEVPNNPYDLALRMDDVKLVNKILAESDKEVLKSKDRFENLAKELRELFPAGKKAGTNYMWRDSVNIISTKLKTLVKKYGDCFTDEQAIEATKKYVEGFNGDYTYMQLLKYFISKRNPLTGEDSSQLLSYIENAGQEDINNNAWSVDLK